MGGIGKGAPRGRAGPGAWTPTGGRQVTGVQQTGTNPDGTPVYKEVTAFVSPQAWWQRVTDNIPEQFIYDASFVKIRQLNIDYTFPKTMLRNTPFKDLAISLIGRNLFTLSKHVPNVDPESSYNNGNGQGFEYGSLLRAELTASTFMQNSKPVNMKLLQYILIGGLTITMAGSCTKDFDSINTDPTRGASIAPGQQLTAAAYYLTGGRETGYPNLYYFLPRSQYVSGAWGMRFGGKYVRNDFYNERMWEIFYGKSLKQLIDMIERSKNDPDLVNYVAAGRILKAYIFSLITDAYGDVPYSQAGTAFYTKIYTPKYDPRKTSTRICSKSSRKLPRSSTPVSRPS